MENFSTLIENSKRAVRYWWLLLIIGIALFVVGILVFVYPTQSYLGMSLLFGWLMLISGILEVVLSSVNKHFITGRGWMLAGGIIEIVLGIILIFNVALSAATLPIFLGFWLMLRAFGAIGLGSDMGAMQIAGSGWTIFSGILLLLCSLWILFQPLVFGTTAVVIWVGISLLFAGIAACSLSIQLRPAPRCLGPRCFFRTPSSLPHRTSPSQRGAFFVLRRRTGNSAVPKQRLPHKKSFTRQAPLRRGLPFPAYTTAHRPSPRRNR